MALRASKERLHHRPPAIAVLALGVVLTTAGCKKPNANDWASDRYGTESTSLAKEAVDAFQLAEYVAGGLRPTQSAVLPRPYVVFKLPLGQDESRLDYHRVNKAIDTPATAAAVRGFAVVRYGVQHSNKGWMRKRGRGWVEIDGVHEDVMSVTFVDRATRKGTKILIKGQEDDDLIEAIDATVAP